MAEFKLVISDPKTGKSVQKAVAGPQADVLLTKGVGEQLEGGSLGFAGYTFQITGGSDNAGFPMRKSIKMQRARVLAGKSTGFKGRNREGAMQDGLRKRFTVAGEKVHAKTAQVNVKILTYGSESLFPAEQPAAEAAPEQAAA